MKKSKTQIKKLKTYLGRLYRDINRKLSNAPISVQQAFRDLLELVDRLLNQNKLYSLHEPHVSCIAKGKTHKKYEFGSKVSLVTTSNVLS